VHYYIEISYSECDGFRLYDNSILIRLCYMRPNIFNLYICVKFNFNCNFDIKFNF